MNAYPPAGYVAEAMNLLPQPGPDSKPETVEIDARPSWGQYRVTFKAKRNPRQGMTASWFWTMKSGERIDAPA